MSDKKTYEVMEEEKYKKIMNDKDLLEKIARKEAANSVYSTKQSRFYEHVYRELYPSDSLENKRFLNIGPGSFRHKYWTNSDKKFLDNKTWAESRSHQYSSSIDIDWDILQGGELPLADNSIELVYCSHVIEHIWNNDVRHLLREVCRVLKSGGILRLVTPDADLAVNSWVRKDWCYLASYYWKIEKKREFKHYIQLAQSRTSFFLLDQFSLITHPKNRVNITPGQADSFFERFQTPYDALDHASELSDRDLNVELGRHVNWFNTNKVISFLEEAGFSESVRSSYGQSLAVPLRDLRLFDKTDPDMSLYVDAIK